MLKVLIVAFHCEPGKGSEAGVGWSVARRMAEQHEVWVLTQSRYRSAIERELGTSPVPGLRLEYFDLPGRDWLHRDGTGVRLGLHLYYYLWQWFGALPARRLHRDIGFDLVHHVTVVKYCMPSCLAFVDAPFLWGPVGGGESGPRSFWRDLSLGGMVYEALRELIRWTGEHDPLVRLTARRADLSLATTPETAMRLRAIGAPHVQVFSEIGVTEGDLHRLGSLDWRSTGPLRFISMGNLIAWKGFHLGLRSFAGAGLNDAEYWIVGDGPERSRLERLCADLHLEDRVRFWGRLPRDAAMEKLAHCDVLVHPGLHDSAGWVVLEAMGAARPVLCLDLGGPGVRVADGAGLRIPAVNPPQAVREMAEAMRRLAGDPELRKRMGAAGRAEVWSQFRRTDRLNDFYRMLASPDPGPGAAAGRPCADRPAAGSASG